MFLQLLKEKFMANAFIFIICSFSVISTEAAPKSLRKSANNTQTSVGKVSPLEKTEYGGSITQGESIFYELDLKTTKDVFIDVVLRIDDGPYRIGEDFPLFVDFTRELPDIESTDLPGRPEIKGADIGGILLTSIQESVLCSNCFRTQTSLKHYSQNNKEHWIRVSTTVPKNFTSPGEFKFTLFTVVRPRKLFVPINAVLLTLLVAISLRHLFPIFTTYARAPRQLESIWMYFFFEEMVALPLYCHRKVASLLSKARKLFRKIHRSRFERSLVENLTEGMDEVISSDGVEVPTCRICLGSDDPLIAPCKCTGSMEFVHQDCLDRWRTECMKVHPKSKNVTTCEVCLHPFDEAIQYKGKDLARKFLQTYVENVASSFGGLASFWLFFLFLSLTIRYGLSALVCSAPWHAPLDLSVFSIDSFIRSFFFWGAFYAVYYFSAYFMFLSRGGQGRLYSVENLRTAGLIIVTSIFLSAIVKFFTYLRSETFVWDYELKFMPGVPMVVLFGCLVNVCFRMASNSESNQSEANRTVNAL